MPVLTLPAALLLIHSQTDFAMSFLEFWNRRLSATPGMRNAEKMTISVNAFRDELQLAYDRGRRDALQTVREASASKMDRYSESEDRSAVDRLREMFGW